MKTRILIFINLITVIALNSCQEPRTNQQDRRLNITIVDLLTSAEFKEAGGFVDEISLGDIYVQLKVENIDKDTLYLRGEKPDKKNLVSTYLPATVEYSYYDSLKMNREYHGGAGFNMGLSWIEMPPDSSALFYFYDMMDSRTDSITYTFYYQRDTIRDPDRRCSILITYLLKNKEVVANVKYEDTCAPKAAPAQENQ